MKAKHLLIAVIILFSSSCGTNTQDFVGNIQKISGTLLDIGCMVGIPAEIVCLDSLILYYDRYEGKTITVFDTKNNKLVRRFLSEGRGSGEVITPLKLLVSPEHKNLYVFQIQTGYLNVYALKDIVNMDTETKPAEKYVFGDRPAIIRKHQTGYVGIGMFDDGRFHLYDTKGEITAAAGKYPFKGDEMDHTTRFFIYQGSLCTNPNATCFAMGASYCDNIEFYEIKNDRASLVKQYGNYDVNAQFNNRIELHDDCIMNYKAAYGTARYCYMLYSGKTYFENHRRTFGGKTVRVFDWKGNYIKSYESEKDIFSFCVDETDENMYVITLDNDGEYGIARFKL
jgi:hypothetical protein